MAKKRKRRHSTGSRAGNGQVSRGAGSSARPATARSTGRSRSGGAKSAPERTAGRGVARPRGQADGAPAPDRPRPASPFGSMFSRRAGGTRPAGGLEQPPVAVSIARGMGAVGRSPALLLSSFLLVLGLWLAFSSYGVVLAAAPSAMVLLESLPPLHSFLDIQFLVAGRVVSPLVAVAFGTGLVIVRAAVSALWIGLVLESMEGERRWGPALSGAVARARRSLGPMIGIEGGFFLVAMASLFVASGFLGASLGQLGLIGALVGGLYYFSFAPVVAVAEGEGIRQAVRLGIKAARIPGPRHTLLVVIYLSMALFISVLTPGSRVAAATPTLAVWAFVLFVSFVHVSVLAAFVYRWLLLRRSVLEMAAEEASRPKAASARGGRR